jgi:hypothetical protein
VGGLVDEIVKEATENCETCWSTLSDYRDEAKDDMRFVNGDQWRDEMKGRRYKRPMEVINDSIINKRMVRDEYKKRQATFKIRGIDSGTDPERAEIYQAVAKSIQRESLVENVMDLAFDDMLSCGMGFSLVETDYESPYSFDQQINVRDIEDPFSVFIDMSHKKLDMSDMAYGGFLFPMPRSQYKEEYPNEEENSFPEYDSNVNYCDKDNICLCQYYKADYKDDRLIAVADPRSEGTYNICASEVYDEKNRWLLDYYREQFPDTFKRDESLKFIESRKISERPTKKRFVKWYIMNGKTELDSGDWNSKYIPIIPTLGDRYNLDGDKYFWSLVRAEKSPTRLYNYTLSNSVERLAAQPIAPFTGPAEIFKGHENSWAGANNRPMPYLPYSQIEDSDGNMVNVPPTPLPVAEVPVGWFNLSQQASADKRNCNGLQEITKGVQGNEVSGRAIIERSENSMQTVSVFFERRKFATLLLGRIITDLMPKIYDTRRVVRMLGEDAKENTIVLNAMNMEGPQKGKVFPLASAELDVYVDVGPSREARRKDDQAIMLEALRETPEAYKPAILSHFWSTIDSQRTEQIVQDINKLHPDQLKPQEEQEEQQMRNENAQLKQQNQEMQAQLEQLTQMLQSEQTKAQGRIQETQMKIQGDLQKEALKQSEETKRTRIESETDLQEQQIESKTDIQVELIKQMAEDMKNMKAVIATITPQSEG